MAQVEYREIYNLETFKKSLCYSIPVKYQEDIKKEYDELCGRISDILQRVTDNPPKKNGEEETSIYYIFAFSHLILAQYIYSKKHMDFEGAEEFYKMLKEKFVNKLENYRFYEDLKSADKKFNFGVILC